MRTSERYDDASLVESLRNILSEDKSPRELMGKVFKLMAGRGGSVGGNVTKQKYPNHFSEIAKKRWAQSRSIKSQLK